MLQFRKNTADILKDLIQFYHDCIKMLHFERGKGAGDRNLYYPQRYRVLK